MGEGNERVKATCETRLSKAWEDLFSAVSSHCHCETIESAHVDILF